MHILFYLYFYPTLFYHITILLGCGVLCEDILFLLNTPNSKSHGANLGHTCVLCLYTLLAHSWKTPWCLLIITIASFLYGFKYFMESCRSQQSSKMTMALTPLLGITYEESPAKPTSIQRHEINPYGIVKFRLNMLCNYFRQKPIYVISGQRYYLS